MKALVRLGAAGVALTVGLGALSACTTAGRSGLQEVPLGEYRMVSFDSCADALTGLRDAAKATVGPYGFGGFGMMRAEGSAAMEDTTAGRVPANPAPEAAKAMGAEPATEPNYSGTNTHEAGVDEPDLVKTDGRRIITVSGNSLKVVDVASRRVTASVVLADGTGANFGYTADDLLLSGDGQHALVLLRSQYRMPAVGRVDDVGRDADPASSLPQLILVSLSGGGRVLSTVATSGNIIDARQVGSTARVVIHSSPRLSFPYLPNATDPQRIAANQGIIDAAPLEAWLPQIETTTGGQKRQATIDCGEISRPNSYTATSLLTVLTFDLGSQSLADGQPTTLVANGDTVYSNGPSLYVASRWSVARPADTITKVDPNGKPTLQPATEIYRFDTPAGARPRFAAGGAVPGYLINQYAMSEWDGKLRVATTSTAASGQPSSSGVYVLAQEGKTLNRIGGVEGLGKNEQIYSVRFIGPTGYVVTFRQTDPLYTVDLKDPTKPVVRGELKIPGYSAYLHPAGDGRLIGIGQNANDQGRVSGTQVSLFDVADLGSPKRLAQYMVSGAHSEAEFDPHAFLFWPATGLLVVPLQNFSKDKARFQESGKMAGQVGALVLRVAGQSVNEVGFLEHPGSDFEYGYGSQIQRSLVIDKTLWTVSRAGLMANDLTSLAKVAWIPFN